MALRRPIRCGQAKVQPFACMLQVQVDPAVPARNSAVNTSFGYRLSQQQCHRASGVTTQVRVRNGMRAESRLRFARYWNACDQKPDGQRIALFGEGVDRGRDRADRLHLQLAPGKVAGPSDTRAKALMTEG